MTDHENDYLFLSSKGTEEKIPEGEPFHMDEKNASEGTMAAIPESEAVFEELPGNSQNRSDQEIKIENPTSGQGSASLDGEGAGLNSPVFSAEEAAAGSGKEADGFAEDRVKASGALEIEEREAVPHTISSNNLPVNREIFQRPAVSSKAAGAAGQGQAGADASNGEEAGKQSSYPNADGTAAPKASPVGPVPYVPVSYPAQGVPGAPGDWNRTAGSAVYSPYQPYYPHSQAPAQAQGDASPSPHRPEFPEAPYASPPQSFSSAPPSQGYSWNGNGNMAPGPSGFGYNGMPAGSKKSGRFFAVLFISLGALLLIGLIAAMASYAGGSPYSPFPVFPSEPESSYQEPESSGAESGGSVMVPQGQKPSDTPAPSFPGISIESYRKGPVSAKEIYRDVVESVVGVNTTLKSGDSSYLSEGSGIVLTEDGLILTNAHVLDYSKNNDVSVALYDGREYPASVIGFDKYSDLAILRIDAENLQPAVLGDASLLEVGDTVFAIGNPGGMNYASSLTGGYISALNRSLKSSAMTYIQTDAAINPGNSGGALVNDCGQIVGINSNKIVSTSYEGMGFAIPISQVKATIDSLITKGYVEGRGRLGITVAKTGNGRLQLQAISEESDLYGKAEEGDYLLEADGASLSSMEDLYLILAGYKAGDAITLKIFDVSEGAAIEVKVRLLPDRGETQQPVSP